MYYEDDLQLGELKQAASHLHSTYICTLKMFCLGNVDDDAPPATVSGKAALSNCGLGPGAITRDVNAPNVHESLTERFLPISSAGGYEHFLYQSGGENRGFYKLPTPYSPP